MLLTLHSMGGDEYLFGSTTYCGRYLDARKPKRGVWRAYELVLLTILNTGFRELFFSATRE